jgi:N-formylglutamate deformylase
MPKPVFVIDYPQQVSTCVVFASPHSGRRYPKQFIANSLLDGLTLRSSEDAYVDLLFGDVTQAGAPLMRALMPRAFVDLNRSRDELDPALVLDVGAARQNPRVAYGLGVIPRVVARGRAIQSGKMTTSQADERLQTCWDPYHGALRRLMDQTHARFGRAILVDCHSMPREALMGVKSSHACRPDVVLGDLFGGACDGAITDHVAAAFTGEGFTVARNTPFAGAYITKTYGRPLRNFHAIQIEIDRSIYMDESTLRILPQFNAVRARLGRVSAQIAAFGRPCGELAAE